MGSDAEVLNTYLPVFQTAHISSLSTVKTSRCGALWFLTGKARQARLAATLRFTKGSELSLLDKDTSLF